MPKGFEPVPLPPPILGFLGELQPFVGHSMPGILLDRVNGLRRMAATFFCFFTVAGDIGFRHEFNIPTGFAPFPSAKVV
jgi:hypothetical protein